MLLVGVRGAFSSAETCAPHAVVSRMEKEGLLYTVAAKALLHVSLSCCLPCPMGEAVLSQGVSSLPADVLDAPPRPGIWSNLEWANLQNWTLRFGASLLGYTAKQAKKGEGQEEGGNKVEKALEDAMKGPVASSSTALSSCSPSVACLCPCSLVWLVSSIWMESSPSKDAEWSQDLPFWVCLEQGNVLR